MVLQWATKRLCKFFLKRLNRFLNEEIDVEQLDVQLGSGTARLTDLVLNTDYINDQVKSLPFILKYGSIAQILVRLPSDIELHGLELLLAPREKVADYRQDIGGNVSVHGASGSASPPDTNPTYLGVSDGVRIIGQMIKSLLLCLRVKVTGITIAFEGGSDDNFLKLRVPYLEYGSEDLKQESEPGDSITKVIKVEQASVEVENKPVFDQRGVSGLVRVSAPLTPSGISVSRISLHLAVEPVQLRAGFEEVEKLVSVVTSYGGRAAAGDSIYHDATSFYDSRSIVMENNNKSEYHGKFTLPVIADWMRKPEIPQPDLEASVDEFFECIDQSASSSDIWNWTRSAFGAPPVAPPGASEETQVQFSVTSKLERLSAIFFYDGDGEGLEVVFQGVGLNARFTHEDSTFETRISSIEITQLGSSSSQNQCCWRFSRANLPKYPVGLSSSSTKLKLLKVVSSSDQPAAKALVERYSQRKGSRTKLSLTFQPLVLWIDDRSLQKLLRGLTRLRNSLKIHCSEKDADSSKSDLRVDVSIPALRSFFSWSSREACILALDVLGIASSFSVHRRSFSFTAGEAFLYTICETSSSLLVRISGKTRSSVEVKWRESSKAGSWIPKKVWEGVVAQRMSYESSGGSTATTLGSETGSPALDLLKATSSLEINVSVPRVLLDFSRAEHFEALGLFSHLGGEDPSEAASQILVNFSAREVCVNVEPLKSCDPLQVRVSRLRAVVGAGLGRDPSASYLRISHGDGEVLGGKTEFVSFKASDVGRGDGGSRNALATGAAGLSLSLVSWPGREELADVIVAGSVKGMTLLTEAGEFDWLKGLISFSERCSEVSRRQRGDETSLERSSRLFFLLDLQDTAVRYEPGSRDSNFSSIGCVLAFAALRVSSGEAPSGGREDVAVSLRDVGLHVVDTRRRSELGWLQDEGCVQVARAPVVGATVKINAAHSPPRWEIESVDNQLNVDTCSDSLLAFGRLVSDLQQIFAPDLKKTAELQLRRMKGKSPVDAEAEEISESRAEGDLDGLFSGLVEDAFAFPQVGDFRAASSSSTTLEVEASSVSELEGDEQPDSPIFIEDYVLERVTHVSSSSSHESQALKQQQHQVVFDTEPSCGWFSSSVDVIDTHVPLAKGNSPKKVGSSSSSSSSSGYPEAVGRLVFSGWKIRWRLCGGSDWDRKRSNEDCMEVMVDGVDLNYDSFAPTGLYASSLILKVRDVFVYDCRDDAPWRVILGYYHKKTCPRESTSRAVEIHMDAVRPNPMVPLEEYRLLITLLPLRVRLDQEHVDFFIKFFASEKESDDPLSTANDDAILPFFQLCEIRSSLVRIDYIPRKLNYGALRSGNFVELLNLCSWKGVKLQLKPVHASGVYGWSSLMGLLLGQWLEDISRYQIHQCLIGAAPIRPVCAVSSGAAKLIILPAEQYRKDRRFLRGVRKGAIAFIQSVSLEALGLGANLAAGAHHILVHTEKALGGGGGGGSKKEGKRKSQPGGALEGLQQAYESIAQGLERSAVSLVANPVKVYQRGGGAGVAVASAIKASPTAILAPASAAADAVRHALLGVRNGLDPERKRVYDEKHTGPGRWR